MSDTFTSEATVQRKLLNSIIPLITHQKIIGAVYKQTTRVVKMSIFIAFFPNSWYHLYPTIPKLGHNNATFFIQTNITWDIKISYP